MKTKNKAGFTLIETIIVMVIMAILATVVAVRWSPFDTIKLNNATRKIVTDIRYAQKLAISTEQKCGIVFSSSTYTIFEKGNIANPAPSSGDVCSTAPDGADIDTPDPETEDFIVDFNTDRCSHYSGITITTNLTNNIVKFNKNGTPLDDTDIEITTNKTVTITYNSSRPITITAKTGMVSY